MQVKQIIAKLNAAQQFHSLFNSTKVLKYDSWLAFFSNYSPELDIELDDNEEDILDIFEELGMSDLRELLHAYENHGIKNDDKAIELESGKYGKPVTAEIVNDIIEQHLSGNAYAFSSIEQKLIEIESRHDELIKWMETQNIFLAKLEDSFSSHILDQEATRVISAENNPRFQKTGWILLIIIIVSLIVSTAVAWFMLEPSKRRVSQATPDKMSAKILPQLSKEVSVQNLTSSARTNVSVARSHGSDTIVHIKSDSKTASRVKHWIKYDHTSKIPSIKSFKIILSKGEKVTSVEGKDTADWKITYNRRGYMKIVPPKDGIASPIIIKTTKQDYRINMVASSTSSTNPVDVIKVAPSSESSTPKPTALKPSALKPAVLKPVRILESATFSGVSSLNSKPR